MSNISPISLRIASKTQCFETSGDSSYYYSNQLLSNLAFLKIASTLGQQLSWPSKPPVSTPPTKQGSVFLAKANLNNNTSRLEPQIYLKGTPGKEWLSANFKLVDKLRKSQQFFHSKAFGLLAKTLGRCGRFNSLYSFNGILQKSQIYSYRKTDFFSTFVDQSKFKIKDQKTFFSNIYTSSASPTFPLVSLVWRNNHSFDKVAFLASQKSSCKEKDFADLQNLPISFNAKDSSFENQVQPIKEFQQKKTETIFNRSLKLPEKNSFPNLNFILPLAKSGLVALALLVRKAKKKSKFLSSSSTVNSFPLSLSATAQRKTLLSGISKTSYKPPFKTPFGLPFYLGCLGLISHCQVLKSSLAVTSISNGSLQSNIALPNHIPVLKTTSSSGLGLASANPKLYIARNHKFLSHYFFFRIPFKFAEKGSKKKGIAKTVYLTAKLQGMQKLQKKAKPFYASVRWL